MVLESKIKPINWCKTYCEVIDQRILPYEYKMVKIKTVNEMYDAIKNMIVRGAPLIGICGAWGVVLAALEMREKYNDIETFKFNILEKTKYLKTARPTAVNLMWAIKILEEIIKEYKNNDTDELVNILEKKALKLEEEDIKTNRKIGEYGLELVKPCCGILTHCNAGALATVGWGTALGVIRSAYEKYKTIKVYADETRPRQQGARLTTWELIEDGIDVTLLTDGMCSYFMKNKYIDMVVVGADRIALNGDTANKIGTYTLAISCNYHKIPFYIAAPLSTIDLNISSGEEIPIEMRSGEEITYINDKIICHKKTKAINPSFDVTPNSLITGIITEMGILRPEYKNSIKAAFEKKYSKNKV